MTLGPVVLVAFRGGDRSGRTGRSGNPSFGTGSPPPARAMFLMIRSVPASYRTRAVALFFAVAAALVIMPLTARAQTCAEHLALAKKLLPTNADSALVHALEAEKRIAELGTSNEKARALLVLGDAQQ